MSDWQPMATAPKETNVLVSLADGSIRILAQFHEPADWESGLEGFWYWDDTDGSGNDYGDHAMEMLGWQPLPVPVPKL